MYFVLVMSINNGNNCAMDVDKEGNTNRIDKMSVFDSDVVDRSDSH